MIPIHMASTATGKRQIKAVLFINDLAALLEIPARTIQYRMQHNDLPKTLRPLDRVGRSHRWSGRKVASEYMKLADADFDIV